jgi:hypothetical protein
MVMFVREGCKFCDQFEGTPGLQIARMVMTPRGLKARLENIMLDPPIRIPGYPALLDGEKVYIGKAAIEERLRRK